MSAIFYAAAHAVPVVLTGIIAQSRGAVTVAAIVMVVLAVMTGSARYAFIDLAFVAIGYFLALVLCPKKHRVPQILNTEYRRLEIEPRPALPARKEKPVRPPPPEQPEQPKLPKLPKAAWLETPPETSNGISKYETYAQAAVCAKALAKKLNKSVSIERGSDETWYVGVKMPEGTLLEVLFKEKSRTNTAEGEKNKPIDHDEDIENRLLRKDFEK
jgi:hypothetical protein